MRTTDLNIFAATRILIIKALNKFRYEYEAAEALGVSVNTLIRLKCRHGIFWDGVKWEVKKQ